MVNQTVLSKSDIKHGWVIWSLSLLLVSFISYILHSQFPELFSVTGNVVGMACLGWLAGCAASYFIHASSSDDSESENAFGVFDYPIIRGLLTGICLSWLGFVINDWVALFRETSYVIGNTAFMLIYLFTFFAIRLGMRGGTEIENEKLK
jgi:hypothetical protein